MFFDLPYDCILLIIDHLYEKKENKIVLINTDPRNNTIKKIKYTADWKKTKKKYNIIKEKYRWEPPSFVSIISLIYTSKYMKNIFDSNDIWSYIYIKEFRNSKNFKRIPKNMKLKIKEKTKNILVKRYEPILEHIIKYKNIEETTIKDYSISINKLSDSIKNVELPINVNDKKINDLYVKIEGGWKDRWGYYFEHDITMCYFFAVSDLQQYIRIFNKSNRFIEYYLKEEKMINDKLQLF